MACVLGGHAQSAEDTYQTGVHGEPQEVQVFDHRRLDFGAGFDCGWVHVRSEVYGALVLGGDTHQLAWIAVPCG